MMDDTNSLIEQRKAKLAALNAKGIDPFSAANKFTPDTGAGVARAKFERGELAEGATVAVAGRITAHRDMGKSIFIDVRDQSGRVQAYAQKQALGDAQFDIFKHLDLGDFVGVRGTMFRTRTNEPSIKMESFTILSKALRPPPAKWHGLEDTEIRYRQRYLDLMANEDVRKTFKQRSDIVHEIRAFFHERGYMEVETPAMQAIPGGAAAQPFKTFHNALGCEFYLRIALELYHKRLLVGGIDKLFEIGKNFRNEGLSRKHNPEFTMLEAYCAFGNYETMMETVESLVKHVATSVLQTTSVLRKGTQAHIPALLAAARSAHGAICQIQRHPFCLKWKQGQLEHFQKLETVLNESRDLLAQEIDYPPTQDSNFQSPTAVGIAIGGVIEFLQTEQAPAPITAEFRDFVVSAFGFHSRIMNEYQSSALIRLGSKWERRPYKDLVREVAGQDWFDVTPAERRRRAMEDLKLAGDIAKGYEDFEVTGAVFEKLIEPTLIQPTFVTHLPKELVPLAKLSPDDPTTVEVFECCINGQEISPGYTEQNDPIAQRATLEHQAGGEQQKLDEDFLVALEHGMPPAGGIGIGIDRLCMMLLGQESIRDVILFPQLKPK